ncbi:MAG: histidine--tRNA ligase [Pseudomonadota bacterium]|nr:histidine--tRNA ligase [Pseudomonadota bacterium]
MNDILPDEAHLWEFFEDTVREWLRAYGYRGIRMPVVENTELFVRSIGDATDIVEKEMYSFTDLNGDSLTLRPEGTASCVRAVVEHNLLYGGPQRLWYSGAMFRHERPQKGRYRQFHQVGVEALGFGGPDIDAEQIAMGARLWRELKVASVTLQINTLGDSESRARYRNRVQDYLQRHADAFDAATRERMQKNPLRVLDSKDPVLQEVIADAPQLIAELDGPPRRHFEELQAILRDAGIVYEINPRLVRGLDYYNLTVFEWVTDRLGAQGTVCAGGRYDGLIEQIGGKPAPACGFAMGIERLLALMAENGKRERPEPHAYIVHQGDEASRHAWRIAERLRDAGFAAILHCGGGGFKAQMKKADASRAHYAVIIGGDEVGAKEVSVKPLRTDGEQRRMTSEQMITLMNSIEEN